METQRNYQIVNLRILAILSVVLGHSCIIYDGYWSTYPAAYDSLFFMWLKAIITAYQMQLFFAISGFLFFFSTQKHSYIDTVKNKSKRLLIPFFFVGLCWLIPVRLIAHYPKYEGSYITGIKQFALSDWGHLWFLPVLFIIFIGLYHLLKRKTRLTEDMFFLTVCLFLALGSKFLPLFALLKLSLNWVFWFVLGFYMNKYGLKFPNRQAPLSIITLISVVLIIPFVAIGLKGIIGSVVGFIASLLIVFALFLYMSKRTSELMSWLDKNSMGIFLFHSPIIYVLYYKFAMILHPCVMVSLNFFVAVSISLIVTIILRKVGLKVLLGE